MELNKEIFIVSRKWASRGELTSVERFCSLLDATFKNYHGVMSNFSQRLSVFLKQRSNSLLTDKGTAYNSNSVKLEMYGIIHSCKRKAKIVFFPYADFDYYYFGFLKRLLNKKIILWTYFSVDELTKRFRNLAHFERADLILVAGKEQLRYLASKLTKPKLVYFPLGVDTSFFKPAISFTKYQIVFSGANRRDFDTAIQAFDSVIQEYPMLQVYFVGCSSVSEKIPPRNYIHRMDYLDDSQLRNRYQNAHLQVLTLLDGGSSNSLLEGYACGIPVICTNLPNIRDYIIEDEELKVTPYDFIELSIKIKAILANDILRNRLATKCRERAEEYDWLKLRDSFIEEANRLFDN